MLNHAKNTTVEVAAFELKKNGETRYYILPWNDNDRTTSRFTTNLNKYGLDGYNEINIMQLYHTHPGSNMPGPTDREWSNNSLIPIWAICPNGKSYIYSPIENTTNAIELKNFLNF
jgi:proteasome lid subunit RPN8/RPN11